MDGIALITKTIIKQRYMNGGVFEIGNSIRFKRIIEKLN